MKKTLLAVAVISILLAGCETCPSKKAEGNKNIATEEQTTGATVKEYKETPENVKEMLLQGSYPFIVDKEFITSIFGSPYAKYRLETGNMEIWFYEKFYVVIDKGEAFLRIYDGLNWDKG